MNEVQTHASAAQSKDFTLLLKVYIELVKITLWVLQSYCDVLNQLILQRVFENSCLCTVPRAPDSSDGALGGLCRVEKEGHLHWLRPKCVLAQHLVPGGGGSGWPASGCSQAGWGSIRRRNLSHCMAHVCCLALLCLGWALLGSVCRILGCLKGVLLNIAFWFMSFNIQFLWFNIFYFFYLGPLFPPVSL